jgi:hypothetical protein
VRSSRLGLTCADVTRGEGWPQVKRVLATFCGGCRSGSAGLAVPAGVVLGTAGAALVQDLHPHDRGPRGTHQGAVIANGNLYCPQAPPHAARTRAAVPQRDERAGRGP